MRTATRTHKVPWQTCRLEKGRTVLARGKHSDDTKARKRYLKQIRSIEKLINSRPA